MGKHRPGKSKHRSGSDQQWHDIMDIVFGGDELSDLVLADKFKRDYLAKETSAKHGRPRLPINDDDKVSVRR